MIEYIIPFLIFVSLGVIIYIVGKHLSEFKKANQNETSDEKDIDEEEQKAVEKFKNVFYKTGQSFKNGFFCLVEIIIKKIKQFLHLIHFWVLKTKKRNNGGDELSQEIEVKRELIEAEEESLEKIMEDDLIKETEIEIKRNLKEEQEVVIEEESIEIKEEVEIDNKLESFFSEKPAETNIPSVNKEKFSLIMMLGGFKKIWDKIKKRKKELKNENSDNEAREINQDELFSDGIIDIKEVSEGIDVVDENNLIKEVVPVVKKEAIDIDDEIGVDRAILEKKFIQKIANNPKDMENYRELGELYIKMKNFSDAEECYRQVLRVHLRDVDAKRKLEKIKLLKRMG